MSEREIYHCLYPSKWLFIFGVRLNSAAAVNKQCWLRCLFNNDCRRVSFSYVEPNTVYSNEEMLSEASLL